MRRHQSPEGGSHREEQEPQVARGCWGRGHSQQRQADAETRPRNGPRYLQPSPGTLHLPQHLSGPPEVRLSETKWDGPNDHPHWWPSALDRPELPTQSGPSLCPAPESRRASSAIHLDRPFLGLSNNVIHLASAEDSQQNKIKPNHSCIFKANIKSLATPYSKLPRQTPPQERSLSPGHDNTY